MIRNWARNHVASPTRIERPADEAGVVEAIRSARSDGVQLKTFGALHSWSDIAMCDERMMSLDALSGVRVEGEIAYVAAGTRLHVINEALAERGLALPILGSVAQQSLAGAVSTGTHGSSRVHGNVASGIVGIRVATGTGELLSIGEQDPRLDAFRVGLGALGVLTEIAIRVVPAFRLAETTRALSLDDAVAQVDRISREAEYVKLWWLPHTGRVQVFAAERTDAPSTYSALGRWIDERLVNAAAFSGVLALGSTLPALVGPLNRVVGRAYFGSTRRVARSDRIFNIAMPPRHREMEYAIPVEATAEALRRTRAIIEERGLRVSFVQEVRFVKGDTGWMSPAGGRDSCQLGAYIAEGADRAEYFAAFEEAMLELGGRPHWGKEFSAPAERVLAGYPRASEFFTLCRELDPEGTFCSPFVQRLMPAALGG